MTTREPVLVMMAKQPAVGQTKTRLCPPLTPAEAAALYEAMLRDTIELVAGLEGVRVAIAVTPPEATDAFQRISPPDAILLPVACTDIGDCLNQVLGRLLADGHSQAIALNSDGPTLPAIYLQQAIDRLDSVDVVLGPSEDGGYYLIGLKQPRPELFREIEWSSERVTAQTLARAEAMGLSVALLPSWYDVDTAADLDRLRAELATLPAETLPHTRRFFAGRLQQSSCPDWSARIEAASAEVEGKLTGLPDDVWFDVIEGAWTAKDVIGHLTAWSDHLLDEAEALARGNADAIQAVDIDAWNAAQVAARRDWPVEQVRAAWERTVRRALRVVARLSADEMSYRWPVPWTDEPVSPADLLDLWLVHIEQHRGALRAWRDKSNNDERDERMSVCISDHLSRYGGLAVGHEDEQKRYFEQKRLYALQIESTDACHQGCIYCYAGSTPQETRGLTSEEIRGLLDDAAALEIRAIDWLGGDPLVRPDWYELMKYAQSLGLINNVWTSGLPLRNKGIAQQVYEVTEGGFVSVHVDSINPETYAQLHRGGNPQYIAAIIEGVDNMLALGKPPDKMINCVTYTTRQGPEDAIETMRWWFEEKGLRTCLTLFNPAGMGAEWRELEPDLDEIQQVYAERDRINYGHDKLTISAMDTDKYYCGTMATVTFTGDVTPCSVIREGVGNIRVTPFRQIVAEHLDTLVHGDLHDTCNLPAPCNTCINNTHCWGCRASAYHYSGDANGLDPKCWLIPVMHET